jgi:hypothetical protein
MKIKDMKLGRKLGDEFLSLYPELEKTENKFKNFKSNFNDKIPELLNFDDIDQGIKTVNAAIELYWEQALYFKASTVLVSNLMNAILLEKINIKDKSELEFKQTIESGLFQKSQIADFSIMLESFTHYTLLENYYYLTWFSELSEVQMESFNSLLKEMNVDEDDITTLIVKQFASPSQRLEIAKVVLEHYQLLFKNSVKIFRNSSLFTKIDSSLSRYEDWINIVVIESGQSLQDSIEPNLVEMLKGITNFPESAGANS